jgi:hypothetical protein
MPHAYITYTHGFSCRMVKWDMVTWTCDTGEDLNRNHNGAPEPSVESERIDFQDAKLPHYISKYNQTTPFLCSDPFLYHVLHTIIVAGIYRIDVPGTILQVLVTGSTRHAEYTQLATCKTLLSLTRWVGQFRQDSMHSTLLILSNGTVRS